MSLEFREEVCVAQGFSTPALLTFGLDNFWMGRASLSCCPVHFRMFISIPGLYPLAANNTCSHVATNDVSMHCHVSPGGQINPIVNHWDRWWLRQSVQLERLDMKVEEEEEIFRDCVPGDPKEILILQGQ